MKLEIAPEVLRDLTAWAVRATPRKPTLPVYGGIRLTAAQDGTLTASATDGDVHHSAEGQCGAVGDAGTAVVPGAYLAGVAATLSRHPVTIAGGEDDGVLRLECRAANFTLPCLPAADHPQMPDVPFEAGKVPGQLLADALTAVLPCADPGNAQPLLTGVEVTASDGRLEFAATNTQQIASCSIPLETAETPGYTLIIPAASLAAVTSVAAEAPTVTILLDCDPEFGTAPVVAGFAAGGQMMVTRLIQGPYVGWRRVLSQDPVPAHTAVVEAAALAAAVKRVGLAGQYKTEPLKLTWRAGHVRLAMGEGEQAGQDTVPVEWLGGNQPPAEIGQKVNPVYVLDGLATAAAPMVHIGLWGPEKKVTVNPEPAERLTETRYFMQPIGKLPAGQRT